MQIESMLVPSYVHVWSWEQFGSIIESLLKCLMQVGIGSILKMIIMNIRRKVAKGEVDFCIDRKLLTVLCATVVIAATRAHVFILNPIQVGL